MSPLPPSESDVGEEVVNEAEDPFEEVWRGVCRVCDVRVCVCRLAINCAFSAVLFTTRALTPRRRRRTRLTSALIRGTWRTHTQSGLSLGSALDDRLSAVDTTPERRPTSTSDGDYSGGVVGGASTRGDPERTTLVELGMPRAPARFEKLGAEAKARLEVR